MGFGLLKNFLQTSNDERVEVLYRYLVQGESGTQIAESYYNNKNYAWKISAITQGYSEKAGVNRGKIVANIDEIRLFVETYLEGTYEKGITLSTWLQNNSNSEISHSIITNQGTAISQNKFIYTSQNSTRGVDEILKYIYSKGLGFASEYKYSLVLSGDPDKFLSKSRFETTLIQSIDFIAMFEDYAVYILGALERNTAILIPFKEIEGFVDRKCDRYLEIEILYKGKTSFDTNYRVMLQFLNQKNISQQKLYDTLVSQFNIWKSEGERNYSSQLPMFRERYGSHWRNHTARILFHFLYVGDSVSEIANNDRFNNHSLWEIAKLLIFDFRLRLENRGQFSNSLYSYSDFERCVAHFKDGIRVDSKEMSGAQPIQNGCFAIKDFLEG